MQKFEATVCVIAVIGIMLNLYHLPGSGIILFLSFSTLSLFYYLGFALFNGIRFKDIFKSGAYSHTNAKRIIGAIGVGFVLSILVMGSLFKLQLYPGGNYLLRTGLLITALIFIIVINFYFRKSDAYFKSILKRLVIIGIAGLILFMTPSFGIVDIYYRNYPELAELHKKVLANPDNNELRDKLHKKEKALIRNSNKENSGENE